MDMLDNSDDFTVRTQVSRLQPLYVAIRHDHDRVEEVIRARVPENYSTYVRSMEIHAAVRTGKDTFVKWLLDRNPENLITYGILEGAARHCKASTFRLLRSRVTGPMTECDFWKEDLLVDAAKNEEHGEKIVRLLLPELQACNEQVYAAAASNENHGLSILRLLFNKFKPTVVDHQTVRAAVSNHETGRAILRLIIAQFPDWKPDEEVVVMNAKHANFWTFKILLDAFSPVYITQEVLIAATTNENSGLELVELLLTYEVEVPDPENVIIAAARNKKSGPELMKLLLSDKFEVTDLDNTIIAAMENLESGNEIVAELLEHFQGVTSLVIETATSMHLLNLAAFERLLSLPLSLDDTTIESATRNRSSGIEIMKLFHEVRKDELARKNNLLAEALTSNCIVEPDILRDVLQITKNIDLVRDALWNATTYLNAEVLSVFLDFVDAPEELVKIIAADEFCGLEMMEMIFERKPSLCITTEAIEIAAQNEVYGDKMVEYLLCYDAEVDISIDAILAATKNQNQGRSVMHLLLPRFPGVVPVDEEITILCASNLAHARSLMEMLLEQSGTDWSEKKDLATLFCETLVQRGNFRCLKSFLGIVRDLGVGMAIYQFGKSPRIDADLVETLLEFCDDDFINCDLIYRVASGEYHEDDLGFLQKLLPRLELSYVSELPIYQLAAGRQEGAAQMLQFLQAEGFTNIIEREIILTVVKSASIDVLIALDFAKWVFKVDERVLQAAVADSSQGLRILQLLSTKDNFLEITEAVLVAAAENKDQAVQVLQFLWKKDSSLEITEAVIEAGARNGNQAVQVLQFLWRKDPSLEITEAMLITVAQNWNRVIQVLQFLWRKDPSLEITEAVIEAGARNGNQAVQVLQ
ncbi:hypothetical protein BGZ60DRAFT_520951, partial [Tricladium varicosporioides]